MNLFLRLFALQWLLSPQMGIVADDAGGGSDADTDLEGTTDQEPTLDYKALYEAEVKAGAGKDKKVSELLATTKERETKERKKQQEKDRANRQNLTADQWQSKYDVEMEKIYADAEKKVADAEAKTEEVSYRSMVFDIITEMKEEVPPDMIKLLTAARSKDRDELEKMIQSASDNWKASIDRTRVAFDNKGRVSSRPKTSNVTTRKNIPSDKEWAGMNREERAKFEATPEDLMKMIKKDIAKPQ